MTKSPTRKLIFMDKWRASDERKKTIHVKICEMCKNEFETEHPDRKICYKRKCFRKRNRRKYERMKEEKRLMIKQASSDELLTFYYQARDFIIKKGYQNDITWCESIEPLQNCHPLIFYHEYCWVVINSGMREQIARQIYNRFIDQYNFQEIGHLRKRKAIEEGFTNFPTWFNNILNLSTDELQIEYLETLPWIGPITKYHLARNIGIDCVKPDRHLTRFAERFGFNSPLELCKVIQNETKEKLGVIDVVLWRYGNLNGSDK